MSNDNEYTPIGFEQLTAFSASKALQSVPNGVVFAEVQAEAQAVRYRHDGATTAPTAAVGMRILTSAVPPTRIYGNKTELAKYRFIEETATAKLNITYFG